MSEVSLPPAPLPEQAGLTTEQRVDPLDFDSAIDAVGNHPAKMLTLLMLAREPDSYFTSTRLNKTFNATQGGEPGWQLQKGSNVPFSYCARSIAPIGMLAAGTVPSERGVAPVDAYKITDEGLSKGVPLAGALLTWELAHPETSIQALLGSTVSWTGRERRMPSLRAELYMHLLTAPGGSLSYGQLRDGLQETDGRVEQLFHNLRDAGVIDIRGRYDPGERTLKLEDPDIKNINYGDDRVSPETNAIYGVVKQLVQAGRTHLTGREFLDAVKEQYPEHQERAVWDRLTVARASKMMKYIKFDAFEGDEKQHTVISLRPEHVEGISSLLESIEKLRTDPAYRQEMAEAAKEILNDPAKVATLLKKARENSPSVNALPTEEWQRIIKSTLSAGVGMDTKALYAKVKEQTGTKISYTNFRRYLSDFPNGEVILSESEAKGKMNRSIGFVTLKNAADE